MLFRTVLLLSAVLLFSACKNNKQIAQKKDYAPYLTAKYMDEKKATAQTEISFWQARLLQDTGSYVNKMELAANYLSLFRLNGDVRYLRAGDSLLKNASSKLKHTEPEILYAISQNAIAQHQFPEAASYSTMAEKAKGDPFTVRLLQFDANMELGRYADAYKALQSLADKKAFDYLIRKAKWEDHKGNLDGAISLMEEAFEKVKDKKKSLYTWTLSNLGDMYGHAGRATDAYKAYLDVLKKDPANLYCLKGIAWIAWSHDKNGAAAKELLQFILAQTEMPELRLLLADICGAEGDEAGKNKWTASFKTIISQPGYGNMYNKYLIDLYTSDTSTAAEAIALSTAEMNNRITPETNDWLAWSYYRNGDIDKAYAIARSNVYNKTFEPDAVLHTAYIFAAKGEKQLAKKLFRECLESSFEIGPVAVKEIKEQLASL